LRPSEHVDDDDDDDDDDVDDTQTTIQILQIRKMFDVTRTSRLSVCNPAWYSEGPYFKSRPRDQFFRFRQYLWEEFSYSNLNYAMISSFCVL
jgi:hypothetical protein